MDGIPTVSEIKGISDHLVLNNIPLLLKTLQINLAHLRSASPYFQNETRRQKACQVDLLIGPAELHFCQCIFCVVIVLLLRD